MGMFEQSLLLDHAAAKKTGAMAASLTAQTLAVSVLIAIPLIFSDHLPGVRPIIPLTVPSAPPPAPPTHSAAPSSSSGPSFASTKIYNPTRVANLSQTPSVSIVDAPSLGLPGVEGGVPGGTGVFPIVGQPIHEGLPQPKPHVVDQPTAPTKPVAIGGDVLGAKLIKKVLPVYPPIARQARISGTVQLIGIIAKDGTIQQLRVVSGNPLLVPAALDAVRQWIYRPTLLNGQAVEVIAPIDVTFTLTQ
jgi:periplasmic protein TonB